jgi:hypothetical protein
MLLNFGILVKRRNYSFCFLNNGQRLVKKPVEKKRQTELELPDQTMSSTRITLYTAHIKARFAQEENLFL